MKRFRLLNDRREIIHHADTTLDAYQWLDKQELGLNSYYIECSVDDIEISDIEFMEAFREGERPEDLTFF